MKKKRTPQQNRALHLLFRLMAEECRRNGITIKKLYEAGFDMQVTEEVFKEAVWKKIQESMFGKDSTKDLTTDEINQIFDVINKSFGEKWNLHIPFPSIENLVEYQQALLDKQKRIN